MTVISFNGVIVHDDGKHHDRIDITTSFNAKRVRVNYQTWPTSGSPTSIGFEFPAEFWLAVSEFVTRGVIHEKWAREIWQPEDLDELYEPLDQPTKTKGKSRKKFKKKGAKKKAASKRQAAPLIQLTEDP